MRNKTLVSLIFLAILAGCTTKEETKPKEALPIPVLASAPSIKDVPVYIESLGTLHPSVFLEIRPQVSGMITQVHIHEGQWVHKGDILFNIDPRPYAIHVQQAQAQLTIDQADLQDILKKYDRAKGLVQKNLISLMEWEEIETHVAKAYANIAVDEARLSSVTLDLERCAVTSPIGGRVGKLDAHEGMLVADGQSSSLASIVKMDPLVIEFTITEQEFSQLASAEKIEIESLCIKEVCSQGLITFVDNQFDSKSGLLLVRGKIDNSDFSKRPGQTVRIRIPIDVLPSAKLIPQKAIRYNQQGPYVYVVQADSTVGFRKVTLGDEQDSDVIVSEGLTDKELVITDGHLRLFPGLKVSVEEKI